MCHDAASGWTTQRYSSAAALTAAAPWPQTNHAQAVHSSRLGAATMTSMPVCQRGSSPPGRADSRGHLCLAFHFGRIMGIRRGDDKVEHKVARSAAAHAKSSPWAAIGLAVKCLHCTGHCLKQPDASGQQGGAGWQAKKLLATAGQQLPWAVLADGYGASKPSAAAARSPRLYKPSSGLMVI